MTQARDIQVTLADVSRMDFRPSTGADQICGSLQRILDLPFRYQIARMAIGRSLSIPSAPPTPGDSAGRSIRGETLFGKEVSEQGLWIALLGQHAARNDLSKKELQELTAAHWCRGASTLDEQWKASGQEFGKFITRLVANRR
ncbi:MAG: DndE family protein [Sphingomonas sp.]|jgi:hypothetical protein